MTSWKNVLLLCSCKRFANKKGKDFHKFIGSKSLFWKVLKMRRFSVGKNWKSCNNTKDLPVWYDMANDSLNYEKFSHWINCPTWLINDSPINEKFFINIYWISTELFVFCSIAKIINIIWNNKLRKL